jgi:serine/threonine-protein kinase
VLLPEHSKRPDLVTRFFNEAKTAASLHHPSLVEVFDFGFLPDGSGYLVMDFLEGQSLAARLSKVGRLSPSAAAEIGRQIAAGVAAAHGQGIVHRDLKPDNIFLVPDPENPGRERVKILDFGIAKLLLPGPSNSQGDGLKNLRTSTGMLLGTPLFMAPEQCRGSGQIDHRADVYSVGCILYMMLTGQPPFNHEGVGEVLAAHLHERVSLPRTLSPGLPPALEAIAMRALEKRPEDRFQNMTELGAELQKFQTSLAEPAVGPPGGSRRAVFTLVGGLAALGAAGLFWWRRRQPTGAALSGAGTTGAPAATGQAPATGSPPPAGVEPGPPPGSPPATAAGEPVAGNPPAAAGESPPGTPPATATGETPAAGGEQAPTGSLPGAGEQAGPAGGPAAAAEDPGAASGPATGAAPDETGGAGAVEAPPQPGAGTRGPNGPGGGRRQPTGGRAEAGGRARNPRERPRGGTPGQAHYKLGIHHRTRGEEDLALLAFRSALAAGGLNPDEKADAERQSIALRRKFGEVEVLCDVADALVAIDGRPVGRTPLPRPILVTPGSHRLTITRAGYRTVDRKIDVAPGGRLPLRFSIGR